MSAHDEGDPRRRLLAEIVRLAREDRGRGVQSWLDPALAADLRTLVKEIDEAAGARTSAPRPAAARAPAGRAAGGQAAGRQASGGQASGRQASGGQAPGGRASPASGAAPPIESSRVARTGTRPKFGPPPEATGREPGWEEQLQRVGEEAAACVACGLCRTRRTVVFGTGSARVPLVFVGEAPGHDEDVQGIPFVGRAGQLLTRIIEAIEIPREDVYICNVLKCRPPENRNPAPEEIASCRHFLERQLAILRPKVVCTLGLFASQLLLESAAPIGKLRGRLFTQGEWRIFPTYHPAALLRNPSLKATVWEDVQLLRRILDE